MKNMSDSYLYQTAGYEKTLFNYIMHSDRVNKNDSSFSDIIYEVKRQQSLVLMKVLMSNKVVLMLSQSGVSRAFKVIYAKDVKNDNQKKVFIDCAGVITYENGVYKCKKIGNLLSHLMTAMAYIIYDNLPKVVTSNTTLMKSSTEAFVDMSIYILGYLKAPITVADNKQRMGFILAEYFQNCLIGLDKTESTITLAKKVSKVEEKKTCDYLNVKFGDTIAPDVGFDPFLKKFAEVFLDQTEENKDNLPKNKTLLTTDSFVQRWMYAFGPSTFLGLELFVPFATILTDCSIGAFLNQQNTIEKVVGPKNITLFANELTKIGSENA